MRRSVSRVLQNLEDRVNPVVLEGVGQLPEHGEDIAEALGQRGVDLVLDCAGVAQVEDMDVVARLADALNATFALFEPIRMARRTSVPSAPQHAQLTPETMRTGVRRLEQCIERVEAFDPAASISKGDEFRARSRRPCQRRYRARLAKRLEMTRSSTDAMPMLLVSVGQSVMCTKRPFTRSSRVFKDANRDRWPSSGKQFPSWRVSLSLPRPPRRIHRPRVQSRRARSSLCMDATTLRKTKLLFS